jgi:hypothetical protein
MARRRTKQPSSAKQNVPRSVQVTVKKQPQTVSKAPGTTNKPKDVTIQVGSNSKHKSIDVIKSTAVTRAEKNLPVTYNGLPLNRIVRVVTPADVVLAAQLCVLRIVKERPALFTYPATSSGVSPNYEPPAPSECVGYLVMAYLQMLYEHSLVATEIDIANAFPKEFSIPVEWAHWVKYQVLYKGGHIEAETRLNLTGDFIINTSEVQPTGVTTINPLNLCALAAVENYGLNDVGIYNWTQGNASYGDATLFQSTLTYSGVYEGATPFRSSGRLELINNIFKRNVNAVPLSAVTRYAPDLSAWGVPVGMATSSPLPGWSQFSGIMNNSWDFDNEMVPVLRPNINATTDTVIAGSFLGAMKCVPMGTQLLCQPGSGIPVISSTPMEFQLLQQFFWIGSRNKYFHGKCFDKNGAGFRIKYDGTTFSCPKMCEWVAKTIDYNCVMTAAIAGLFYYVNQNVQPSYPTSDLLANFICCVDSMIADRCNTLGNVLFVTGDSPSPSFVPQCLSPNRCTDLSLPLFLKAILDSIGPNLADGVFEYPIMYLNCGGTQVLANTPNTWSKYGLLPAANNRFISQLTGVGYSSGPFTIPMNSIYGAPSPTFTPFAGYGGFENVTGIGEIYKAQYAASSASTFQTNAATAPLVNGHSPQNVYWFVGVANMWSGVQGYFKLRGLNAKNVSGTQHLGWGGPGMSSTVLMVPQASGSVSQGGVTTKMYDTTNGFGVGTIAVEANTNNLYFMWAPRRLSSVLPLSRRDCVMAVAFGPCRTYINSGAIPPVDVRGPTFITGLTDVSGQQIMLDFFDQLIGTETSLIREYMGNQDHAHQKMSTALTLDAAKPPMDCLKLPFTKAADQISASMNSINEWTQFIPVPAVARSLWVLASKGVQHYGVLGTKINKYYSDKRKKQKQKRAAKKETLEEWVEV